MKYIKEIGALILYFLIILIGYNSLQSNYPSSEKETVTLTGGDPIATETERAKLTTKKKQSIGQQSTNT